MFLARQIAIPILLCLISAGIALGWQYYSGFSNIRTLIIGCATFCVFMVLMNHVQLAMQSSFIRKKLAAVFRLEDNLLQHIQQIEKNQSDSFIVEELQQRIGNLEDILKKQTEVTNTGKMNSDLDLTDGNVVVLKPKALGDVEDRKKPVSPTRVYKPTLENLLAEEAVSIKLQPIIHLMSKDVLAVEAFAYLETKNGEQSVMEVLRSFNDELRCELDLIMMKRLSAIARAMEIEGQLLAIHYAFASVGVAENTCWTKIRNVLKGDAKLAKNLVAQMSFAEFRRLGEKEIARFLEFKELGVQPCLTDCQGVNLIVQTISQHRIPVIKITVQELLSYTHIEGERIADILLPKLSKLGVETIVNSVEKAHQAANLIDLDVSLAQGPFISPARSLKTDGLSTGSISSIDNVS